MLQLIHWLRDFYPAPIRIGWRERARTCIGALIGIALTSALTRLLLGPSAGLPLLIAPMGASAVLLFALPASPLAQPWSIMGGNLVSALVGVTCANWIADPLTASAVAVAMSIGAMFALRCLHPPSGAVALTAVLGGPVIHALGYGFVLVPVALNSAVLLAGALIYHAATRHRYPHPVHGAMPKNPAVPPAERLGFTRADLDAVLRHRNELLDIDPADLEMLLREAELHAYWRRAGNLTCADIMSRQAVTVSADTPIVELIPEFANRGHHHIQIVDDKERLVGIVTQADLITGLYQQKVSETRAAA